jgi:protoheme ferro-lyase
VEILYDIDILFQQAAAERGMVLRRTASLNEDPTLINALAALVQRDSSRPAATTSSSSRVAQTP